MAEGVEIEECDAQTDSLSGSLRQILNDSNQELSHPNRSFTQKFKDWFVQRKTFTIIFVMMLMAILAVTTSKMNTLNKVGNTISKVKCHDEDLLTTIRSSTESSTTTTTTIAAATLSLCFKKGTCRGDLLDHYTAHNLTSCMRECQNNIKCQWTSFDHHYHYCSQLSNCPTIDFRNCEKCLSSSRDCSLEHFNPGADMDHEDEVDPDLQHLPELPLNDTAEEELCNVVGRCKGIVIEIYITKQKCHEKCHEERNCNWYSFGNNICMLFHSCPEIDDTKANFITQYHKCSEPMFENNSYTSRYPNHVQTDENWYYYLDKKISNVGGDCGLYCEEDHFCDFFVPYGSFCFLGSFRKDVHRHRKRMEGTVYFVYKNKTEQFSLIRNRYVEKDYEFAFSASFFGEKLIHTSYNLTHTEFCPLMCKFSDNNCQFWIAIESNDNINCFVGELQSYSYSWKYSYKDRPKFNLSSDSNKHVNVINHPIILNLNLTKLVLQAYRVYYDESESKPYYGSYYCNGTGVHLVNSTSNWTMDLTLVYGWNAHCTFIFIRLFDGKMRLTVPNFKSEEDIDVLSFYNGTDPNDWTTEYRKKRSAYYYDYYNDYDDFDYGYEEYKKPEIIPLKKYHGIEEDISYEWEYNTLTIYWGSYYQGSINSAIDRTTVMNGTIEFIPT